MRERLLPLLAAHPGLSTRAIADAVSMSESTVAYHLRRLVREGEARSQVVGRDRCWYAKGCDLCPILRRAVPRLRRPAVAQVALALEETPRTASELSERAGLDRGSVRWASQELTRTFLAEKTRGGRVFLRHGADVCLAKGLSGESCTLWKTCPVGQAYRDALLRAGQ